MDPNTYQRELTLTVQADFDRARRKAFLADMFNTMRGEGKWLLSFEEVSKNLSITGQNYAGLQQVPVASIVGSVDRYQDFNRTFLPVQNHTRPRWESIDRATLTDVALPPVQLYRVSNIYFVKDGNHRVSVAKEKGQEYLDAEVIDCPVNVTLEPNSDPRDLIRLGEYARFLQHTHLDKLRPGVNITFTTLGRYDELLEHISGHRWYMGIDRQHPIEWEEALLDWYDNVYMPVVNAVQEYGVLDDFPGRTTADLYLWVMDHRWYIREDTGHDMGPTTGVLSYDTKYASWTRKVLRSLRRFQRAASQPLKLSARRTASVKKQSPEIVDSKDG